MLVGAPSPGPGDSGTVPEARVPLSSSACRRHAQKRPSGPSDSAPAPPICEQELPPPAVNAATLSRVVVTTETYHEILWSCRFISLSSGYVLS